MKLTEGEYSHNFRSICLVTNFSIFIVSIFPERHQWKMQALKKDRKINFDGFEYVVEKQEQANLCFGSTKEKKIKFFLEPNFITPSPFAYDLSNTDSVRILNSRPYSKKGSAALVSEYERFQSTSKNIGPGPDKYNLCSKWAYLKQDKAAFGSNTKRPSLLLNCNPGVGTYSIGHRVCRRTKFQDNFGCPTMVNAVETICISLPIDKCDRCLQIIQGDYWHKNLTNYICQPCMMDEKKVHEMYSEKQLKEFKKIRNCCFMHRHENTTAAIRLLPPRLIQKRICHENYLSLFMKSGN